MSNKAKLFVITGCVVALAAGGYIWVTTTEPSSVAVKPPPNKVTKVYEDPDVIAKQITAAETSEEFSKLTDVLTGIAREAKPLRSEEIASLIAFIKKGRPEHVDKGDWYFFINETFNVIHAVAKPEEHRNVAPVLAYLAENGEDQVVRLYALQHLTNWFGKAAEHKALLVEVLRRSAMKHDDTAGTAVEMLTQLSLDGHIAGPEQLAGLTDEYLELATLQILNNVKADDAVKISAISACTRLKLKQALPQLRLIAQDRTKLMRLRKASIAAIGILGTSTDIKLLQKLTSQGSRIAQATKPAIVKLTKLPQ